MDNLQKTLTRFNGTALFLNIVIGAGLLVIPGLAYQQISSYALYSWLLCVLVAFPLLLVFIILGKNYPNSGGISFYAFKAFGSWMQRVSSFLLLGAVVLGLPSIAMTGGYYLNSVLPLSVHLYAASIVLFAALSHFMKSDFISKILGWIGSTIIIVLLILLIVSFSSIQGKINTQSDISLLENLHLIFIPFMMIFFAFTGWEIGSHAAEEFKNPLRDFPLAMLFSYIIASLFYLAIAWVIQNSGIHDGFKSPFISIIKPILGSYGTYFVAFTAVLLIFANLFGAVWGISRLIYSLGRDGILPKILSSTNNGTPRLAVFIVFISLESVISLDYVHILNIESMLSLAGQNFLILYGIASASLFVLTNNILVKVLTIGVSILVLVLLYIAGMHLIYPILLIFLATIFSLISKNQY